MEHEKEQIKQTKDHNKKEQTTDTSNSLDGV